MNYVTLKKTLFRYSRRTCLNNSPKINLIVLIFIRNIKERMKRQKKGNPVEKIYSVASDCNWSIRRELIDVKIKLVAKRQRKQIN